MNEHHVKVKVIDDEEKLMEYIKRNGFGFIKTTDECMCSKERTAYLLTYHVRFDDFIIICPKCYKYEYYEKLKV